MPNLHDIERRINSVTSTKQITRTMEMVAAAKIRRASERIERSLPWAAALSDLYTSTAKVAQLDEDPLIQEHSEVKRSLIMVVTSDRGLAGGFNSNALRAAEKLMRAKERQGIKVDVVACGKKAIGYFSYRGVKPVMEFRDLSADPTYEQAAEIAQLANDGYIAGDYDEFIIVFNHTKNSAEQRVINQTILPIQYKTFADQLGIKPFEKDLYFDFRSHLDDHHEGDVDFEPSPKVLMDYLGGAFLRSSVFYALVDSAAGEQGARRTAMNSATENATDMINTLSRLYNRERQGAITTEITEIVGGAAALEE